MPEGDTIHKLAARLRPALEGQRLVRFEASRLSGPLRPRPGMVIESVGAHGKHLLIRFERDLVLEVHLGMVGTWQLARPGERLRKPPHLIRARVGVEGGEAIFFTAPTVRVFVDRGSDTPISHLGPDLAVADPDIDAALARTSTVPEPDLTIAEVLLDQRVAAGIGNVFKSEVLWTCRVDPFAPISAVDEPTRRLLLETAATQIRANLRPGRRQTVPTGYAVYRRHRQPCLRCGTPVQMRHHGDQARSTYWCPKCQALPDRYEAPEG
jgi:endonuclease-8